MRIIIRKSQEEGGRWVTMHGRHVFIKDGQSPEDALKESLEKKPNEQKPQAAKLSPEELRAWIAKNEPKAGIGSTFASDTANELYYDARRTPELVAAVEEISSKSSIGSAIRVVDSGKAWGTGWIAAHDEWNAASKLGGSGSMPKATIEDAAEAASGSGWRKPKEMTEDALNAFKARREIFQKRLLAKNPDGFVTVYRGISGAQARKLIKENPAKDQEVDLGVHQLSSWSMDEYDAGEFAFGPKRKKVGVVLSARIPIKDVWTAGRIGQGVIRFEDTMNEVVTLNAQKTIKAKVVSR